MKTIASSSLAACKTVAHIYLINIYNVIIFFIIVFLGGCSLWLAKFTNPSRLSSKFHFLQELALPLSSTHSGIHTHVCTALAGDLRLCGGGVIWAEKGLSKIWYAKMGGGGHSRIRKPVGGQRSNNIVPVRADRLAGPGEATWTRKGFSKVIWPMGWHKQDWALGRLLHTVPIGSGTGLSPEG